MICKFILIEILLKIILAAKKILILQHEVCEDITNVFPQASFFNLGNKNRVAIREIVLEKKYIFGAFLDCTVV